MNEVVTTKVTLTGRQVELLQRCLAAGYEKHWVRDEGAEQPHAPFLAELVELMVVISDAWEETHG